ncbi:MAG: Conjugation TrbI-like protein [Verrucomicrobiaceae bacterium]|nr:Conjugation TrbI-like protein [Verrucomicrobiaceae bacterium]
MVAYLQKPAVQMVLFATAVIGAGAFFYTQDKRADVTTAPSSPPPKGLGQVSAETVKVERQDVKSSETTQNTQVEKLVLPPQRPEPPTMVKETTKKEEKPKPPTFPNLVQMTSAARRKPFIASPPKVFSPPGTLIKAALVITLESNAVGTPVLALVTEDVYFQGDLIVPAGTQVQASAMANSKFRDRIDVRGTFTFIWADGAEYSITGIALDHEPLPDGTFSLTDGSPGIRGRVLKTDEYAELKLLAAEAVKGLMNNGQSQFQSVYGLVPENTNRNAALGGGAGAAGAYAGILSKSLEKDSEYVQVPAGTSFYIYTTALFEPELRSIAGIRQGNQPTSGIDAQKAAFEAAASAASNSDSEMRARLDQARAADFATAKSQQQTDQIERTKILFAPTSSGASAAAQAAGAGSPGSLRPAAAPPFGR